MVSCVVLDVYLLRYKCAASASAGLARLARGCCLSQRCVHRSSYVLSGFTFTAAALSPNDLHC